MSCPKSFSSRLIHTPSLMASDNATYSASVGDYVTKVCFLLLHMIGDPRYLKTNPVLDFLSDVSPAQSASANPMSLLLSLSDKIPSFSFLSLALFKYLKTRFISVQSARVGYSTLRDKIDVLTAMSGLVLVVDTVKNQYPF